MVMSRMKSPSDTSQTMIDAVANCPCRLSTPVAAASRTSTLSRPFLVTESMARLKIGSAAPNSSHGASADSPRKPSTAAALDSARVTVELDSFSCPLGAGSCKARSSVNESVPTRRKSCSLLTVAGS